MGVQHLIDIFNKPGVVVIFIVIYVFFVVFIVVVILIVILILQLTLYFSPSREENLMTLAPPRGDVTELQTNTLTEGHCNL